MAIRQASVSDLRKGNITRENAYVVVAMCFHPRGLSAELRDEYRADLAPDRELFKDFKVFQKTLGHAAAFRQCGYERRFTLRATARVRLSELAVMSWQRDVYLVCQCKLGELCHREMLMLTARILFGAETDDLFHEYALYLERLVQMAIEPGHRAVGDIQTR